MEKLRLLVTSSKGGIGKSTVAAGLARAMTERGRRVLLVDCDWGNASLDLILGTEDKVLFTVRDLMEGRCGPEDVLIHPELPPHRIKKRKQPREDENLLFAPAPRTGLTDPDGDELVEAIRRMEEAAAPDAVILDTAAGISLPPVLCRLYAKEALAVTSQLPTALRAAENTSRTLRAAGADRVRLIINNFTAEGISRGRRPGILSVIDQTETRTVGVIPHDPLLAELQERGSFPDRKHSTAAAALGNIAGRLLDENIPLFTRVKGWRLPRLM